jgi:hypothetical protein
MSPVDAMDLRLYVDLVAVPFAFAIFLMIVLSIKTDVKTRKIIFQKISEEYGFKCELYKYRWYEVFPGKILLRMTGIRGGHPVLIEDVYTSRQSPASLVRVRTEVTIDGTLRVLNRQKYFGFLVLTQPGTYKQIKAALDTLT